MQEESILCPCCSGEQFKQCCQEIVAGTKLAHTPLALMRSRYVAHVLKHAGYLARTMLSKQVRAIDLEISGNDQFDNCHWSKLEIIEAPKVPAGATHGIVEFKAYYTLNGLNAVMHERSKFSKIDDQWFYLHELPLAEKPARNEPCHCGSGVKFKKCCLIK